MMADYDNFLMLLRQAEELLLAGQFDEAARILANLVRCRPSSVTAWSNFGVAHYQRFGATGDKQALAAARAAFEHAVEIQPDFADALSNLGNVYDDLGELGKAEEFLRRAVAAVPNHADAWCNLGMVLHRQDDVHEAAECYKKAIRADPNHANAWANLGEAFRELHLLDEAIKATQRALDIRPDHPQAVSNMRRLRKLADATLR